MIHRRTFVQASPAIVLAAMPGSWAQVGAVRYPSRPLRLIVPYPPGTASDNISRQVAQKLAERLGQPVMVDNRPGANGVLGTTEGARAAPDGHTLTLGVHGSMVMNPHLHRRLSYNTSSFEPVAGLIKATFLLVAAPDFPANSLDELIAEARRRPPGDIHYGTYGLGSNGHLAGAMLNAGAGISLNSVHYSTPPIVDVISGAISLSFEPFVQAVPYIRERRVKALAVTSAERHAAFPEVPAIAERLPGYEVAPWFALFAPRGTPASVVERLSQEVMAILQLPDVAANIAATGSVPLPLGPTQLKALVERDVAEVSRLFDASRLSPN
jgi:tripartite-type tricarboxylate transporter receptor subunit TctC